MDLSTIRLLMYWSAFFGGYELAQVIAIILGKSQRSMKLHGTALAFHVIVLSYTLKLLAG